MKKKKFLQNLKSHIKSGFTIVELTIVIAIIGVISALILFNSGSLNSSLLLSNTAYEMGLIVREVQIAGLGVRATDNSGAQNFTFSQGVHIDIAEPNQMIVFSDKNNNGKYDGSIEDVQLYAISNGRAGKILATCAVTYAYAAINTCTTSSPDYTPVLDILFTRPNPEAFFMKKDSNGILVQHYNPVVINVGFEGDICRTITVQKTGAVQVDTSYCVPIAK